MLVLKNTIKECRVEKHINQQQMADDLGVTRETDAPGCAPRPSGRLRTAVPWCIGVPVEGEHLEKWGRTKEDLLAAVFSIPW